METKTIIMITTIIVGGSISFFFTSIHQSVIRLKKMILQAQENYSIVTSIGAAILKASCCVLWLSVIIVIMIEPNISTNMIIVYLLSTGSGAYLGYICTNWWINRKIGIIELFGWLFSKKFIYQSKFSMFF